MMGTGEAEGDNRAMAATELALNNPLIDEYTYKGLKDYLSILQAEVILNFLKLMQQ